MPGHPWHVCGRVAGVRHEQGQAAGGSPSTRRARLRSLRPVHGSSGQPDRNDRMGRDPRGVVEEKRMKLKRRTLILAWQRTPTGRVETRTWCDRDSPEARERGRDYLARIAPGAHRAEMYCFHYRLHGGHARARRWLEAHVPSNAEAENRGRLAMCDCREQPWHEADPNRMRCRGNGEFWVPEKEKTK